MTELYSKPPLVVAIESFNCGGYFTSHEVWEGVWMREKGPDRSFYKGLIQAAVALHHATRGNHHGARKLWRTARSYLDPYRPRHLGIDVECFLTDLDRCLAPLAAELPAEKKVVIDPGLLPTIQYRPPGGLFPAEKQLAVEHPPADGLSPERDHPVPRGEGTPVTTAGNEET